MPWSLTVLLAVNILSPHLTVPIDPLEEARSEWQNALAQCESGGDPTIKVLDTNNYYSYGKYQYQMKTWLKYKNLGTSKENIYDEDLQDRVTAHILNTKGSSDWWNCTKAIGPYPKNAESPTSY